MPLGIAVQMITPFLLIPFDAIILTMLKSVSALIKSMMFNLSPWIFKFASGSTSTT